MTPEQVLLDAHLRLGGEISLYVSPDDTGDTRRIYVEPTGALLAMVQLGRTPAGDPHLWYARTELLQNFAGMDLRGLVLGVKHPYLHDMLGELHARLVIAMADGYNPSARGWRTPELRTAIQAARTRYRPAP